MNERTVTLQDILAELKAIHSLLQWNKDDTLALRARDEAAQEAERRELLALQDRMADVMVEKQKAAQREAYAEHVAAYHQDMASKTPKDNPPRA